MRLHPTRGVADTATDHAGCVGVDERDECHRTAPRKWNSLQLWHDCMLRPPEVFFFCVCVCVCVCLFRFLFLFFLG